MSRYTLAERVEALTAALQGTSADLERAEAECDRYREALAAISDMLTGWEGADADVFAAQDRAEEALSAEAGKR